MARNPCAREGDLFIERSSTRRDLMTQTLAVDIHEVRPRFGRLTKVLAVVFLLAGIGAVIAGVSSGHQTTPGSAYDGPILLVLGVAFLLVAGGLWVESIWAWWAGITATSAVVIVDVIRGVFDGGFVLWALFFVLFATSAAQGARGRAGQR
jgi:hypothetical protein